MSVRDIRRHAKAELEERIARGEDRTDWARVDALTDQETDNAARQDPDTFVGDEAFWQAAELLYPKVGKLRRASKESPSASTPTCSTGSEH